MLKYTSGGTYSAIKEGYPISGRPDAERSLDKFLEEATDASSSYSFQERFTDAILLAERFHLALVKLPDGSSVFTSCDESGRPPKGHAHAYILSESKCALGRGRWR